MAINPYTIYSKTGKGVQEASGKTGLLARSERAVLQQIDGKTTFADLQLKFEKTPPAKFDALIQQLDNDGFIREVQSSTARQPAPAPARPAPAPGKPAPAARSGGASMGDEEELDFTSLAPSPGKGAAPQPPKPAVDLAAQARADAERRAREQAEFDFRTREEAVARARAEAEAKARTELEAKVKAAREAAVRAAAEAKARAEAEAKAFAAAAEREREAAAVREREALARAQREASEKERIEAELNARLDAEREAREAAERAARELAERERAAMEQARQEAEEKARREADELRRQLEAEKARAEAERRAREESERKAQEAAERRAREERERREKEDAERRTREAAEQAAREERERREKEDAERRAREAAEQAAREERERREKEEAERRAREAAERAAQEQARREAEEAARREAEALRTQLQEERERAEAERRAREESERKAKAEAERQAREAAERVAREEAERQRAAQALAKAEQERKEREDAEREARQAAERAAQEQARREAEELRRQLEAEKARAEAERRAREESERKAKDDAARAAQEQARREAEEKARSEAERQAREASERRAMEAAEQEAREARERAQRSASLAAGDDDEGARKRAASARALVSKAPTAASLDDSLLADLDSFAQRDDEATRAKEAEAQAAKQAAERAAKEAAERAAKEKAAAEKAARDAAAVARASEPVAPLVPEAPVARSRDDARREAEEERRRAREAQARRAMSAADVEAARESELARSDEEDKRRRRAMAAVSGTVLEQAIDEDLEIGEHELGFDEIERERQLIEKASGKRERKPMPQEPVPADAGEPETKAEKSQAKRRVETVAAATHDTEDVMGRMAHEDRPPVPWVKYAAIGLVVVVAGGLGAVHLMPVSTAPYEKAASEALGMPVRIGAARRSMFTGIQLKFERVSIGDAVQIALVRAHGGLGALMSDQAKFDRLELEGASIAQDLLGGAVLGALQGENLKVARITAKQVKLPGPLRLPDVDADVTVGGNGALQAIAVTGADGLNVKLVPAGGTLSLEAGATSFAVPFVPGFSLADFGAKGSVTREALTLTEFDGRVFEGVLSGSAKVRWGAAWSAEGELRVKNLNAAVFAPALLSEGRAEGRGLYSMNGADPAKLLERLRLEGNFKIDKGVLGSFDLGRAIQTNGAQSAGRTLVGELSAQGVYQGGTVQLRNITLSSGALNAGASLDIAEGGTLSGRVVADLKTPAQTFRATLLIGGKTQDPVLRR